MARTDEQIKKDVVDELYWDDRVDASKVTVEVSNVTVTLRGEVPTYFSRTAAYNDTLGIVGVISVRNQLSVRYPTGISVPTDEELESKIRRRLDWNPDIDVLDLEIDVTAGEVTLRGTVDAYWKKIHAEDLVALEPGVVFINNHLAIVPTRDIIDQDIANDIVRSLEARSAVFAEDVNVRVRDGHVVLTGTVPSWTARWSAYDAAKYTAGVVDVDNQLLVSGLIS
ncbi:MAG: BON domain-containing protein [Desulfatiglandaceae bacterium]